MLRHSFSMATGRARLDEYANVTDCGRKPGFEKWSAELGLTNLTFRVAADAWRRVDTHWYMNYNYSLIGVSWPAQPGDWNQYYVNISVLLTDLTTGRTWGVTNTTDSLKWSYSVFGGDGPYAYSPVGIGPVLLRHTDLYSLETYLTITVETSLGSSASAKTVSSVGFQLDSRCGLDSISIR